MSTAALDASTSRLHRSPHAPLAGGVAALDKPLDRGAEDARELDQRRTGRRELGAAGDLGRVALALEPCEPLQLFEREPGTEPEQVQDARTEGVKGGRGHSTYERSHVERTYVKGERAIFDATGETPSVTQRAPASVRSPIATRIRERLAELGLTESAVAEGWGRDRTILSTQLRRLDAGGHLRDDTITKLEKVLGRSATWILTGAETPGVRLADCKAWVDAVAAARERYTIDDDALARAGEVRLPREPRHIEPALVRLLTDSL